MHATIRIYIYTFDPASSSRSIFPFRRALRRFAFASISFRVLNLYVTQYRNMRNLGIRHLQRQHKEMTKAGNLDVVVRWGTTGNVRTVHLRCAEVMQRWCWLWGTTGTQLDTRGRHTSRSSGRLRQQVRQQPRGNAPAAT